MNIYSVKWASVERIKVNGLPRFDGSPNPETNHRQNVHTTTLYTPAHRFQPNIMVSVEEPKNIMRQIPYLTSTKAVRI